MNFGILVFELQILTALHLAQLGPSRDLECALSSILTHTSPSVLEVIHNNWQFLNRGITAGHGGTHL